jgi:hypothetical protein
MSCPADSGLTYRLLFSISGRELAPVSVDATGCGEVRGLGQTRWTARSPASGGHSARPGRNKPGPQDARRRYARIGFVAATDKKASHKIEYE